MARKKNKQAKETPDGGNASSPSGGIVAPLGPALDAAAPALKKDVVTSTTAASSSSRPLAPALPQPPASPALIICRNKSVVPPRCWPSPAVANPK